MSINKQNTGIKILNQLKKDGQLGIINGLSESAPIMVEGILEFIFGTLYADDTLDLKTHQIITLSCLATLGFPKDQIEYHIKNALNIGISKKEIIAIFTHTSGYAGFPAALNAIAVARKVFKNISEDK
ncbi:carboxymuconolactone decarboxylase family protein [Piscirickettsia salmonis]|uniref:carboxymuconolactone decarboxylase family protein n=1 Tax=Piscirickettsia salmonis TaxID=1238 RepID=UPI0007D83811|nr:Carboxymuconolactone decarboxylase family protein [Piscirickettsiaceae bacterium NZ-RLO1]